MDKGRTKVRNNLLIYLNNSLKRQYTTIIENDLLIVLLAVKLKFEYKFSIEQLKEVVRKSNVDYFYYVLDLALNYLIQYFDIKIITNKNNNYIVKYE